MDEQKDIRTKEQVFEEFGDFMLCHFRPAENAGKATQMLNTEQLLSMVNDHSPGLVPPLFFREAMLKLNYVEHQLDGRFVWLLSERN
jgi:hypothetical protein